MNTTNNSAVLGESARSPQERFAGVCSALRQASFVLQETRLDRKLNSRQERRSCEKGHRQLSFQANPMGKRSGWSCGRLFRRARRWRGVLQCGSRPLGGARPPRSSRGAQVGAGGCAEGSWASSAALRLCPCVGCLWVLFFLFFFFNLFEIAAVVELFASEIRKMPSRGIVK